MDRMPAAFDRTVPVPGLIHLAQPPFADVGTPKSNWRIDGRSGIAARFGSTATCRRSPAEDPQGVLRHGGFT